jgi:hypothetical protein
MEAMRWMQRGAAPGPRGRQQQQPQKQQKQQKQQQQQAQAQALPPAAPMGRKLLLRGP